MRRHAHLATAAALLAAGALQLAVAHHRPTTIAPASNLPAAPPAGWLRTWSAAEPHLAAALIVLGVQHYDDQPGARLPFAALDYGRLAAWLAHALMLDGGSDYALLLAACVYAQVPDAQRVRLVLAFVHESFHARPAQRWRWLAHAAIVARHRLGDDRLALSYAEDLAQHAPAAPAWARQMRIVLLQELGERDQAIRLLAELLAGDAVRDRAERRFLLARLRELAPHHPLLFEDPT